jgi:hypothetical protein
MTQFVCRLLYPCPFAVSKPTLWVEHDSGVESCYPITTTARKIEMLAIDLNGHEWLVFARHRELRSI